MFPTPACPSECVVGNSAERDVDETAETAVSSGQDVAALGVEKSGSILGGGGVGKVLVLGWSTGETNTPTNPTNSKKQTTSPKSAT